MSSKVENAPVEASADLGNPRETQSMLAYIVTIGFFAVIGYAISKATTFQDVLGVLSAVSPLVFSVVAYYFANKAAKDAAQAAQAAAASA